MKSIYFITSILAAGFLAGCGQAETAAQNSGNESAEIATSVKNIEKAGVDIAGAPSGEYKSEPGHSHLAFTYSHSGFAKQIIHWDDMDARLSLDSENPENSSLMVTIPVSSIDSGFKPFDEHLLGPDLFDVENHPVITFNSTDMRQVVTGNGLVTGDLTIKGVSKPLTLNVTLNKIGNKFRTGEVLFGVSATGKVKRADFGLDKYAPTANEVDLIIEVEFEKID